MKEISNFNLALTHCGYVILVYWIIKSWIGKYLLQAMLGTEVLFKLLATWKGTVIMFILSLVALLFGMLFSRWQLERNYIIKDKEAVIRSSVIIFLITMLAWNSFVLFIVSRVIQIKIDVVGFVIDVVLMTLIFYWLSRIFLKNTKTPGL
jgi:hypothetical protein